MKLRVVVDSNIYISAIVFGGVPKSVLTLAEPGQFEICISRAIREEVERTLNRKFGWPEERIDMACSPLWDIAKIGATTPRISGRNDEEVSCVRS